MKFGSVCSGIEAASVAWEPLGWEAAWFSEIEPFPCAVLAHHYPDTPNLGDMTALPDRIRSGEVEAPDLFCGGTPCQAFSVAGLRKSLDDARGNLSLTFCEIANAIDRVRQQPAIIFWENVPGVLSTKDNAFGCFLGALAGEDDALIPPGGRWANAGFVDGPQRAVAWRVLDAQYFGVAQRRRRVFVVASARADFDPAAVLFEFEGLRRDFAPSREKGEVSAARTGFSVTGSVTGGFGPRLGTDESCQGSVISQPYPIANTLTARMAKGINSTAVDEGQTPVIAWDEELNATIEQAGTLLRGGDGGRHDGVLAPTLTASNDPSRSPQSSEITAQVAAVVQATAAVATGVFFAGQGAKAGSIAYDQHIAPTLKASDSGTNRTPSAHIGMQVRRLTPVECERLQGFPDNYTAIPWRKKPTEDCPDGPRYKALGNSWAVPVVRWIGERIARVA